MPTLDIDMFDEAPEVGDKVKVTGKVKSIDEDSGEVKISYDDVSIIEEHKKRKKKRDYVYSRDEPVVVEDQMPPNSQTLDQALAQSFPNTQ